MITYPPPRFEQQKKEVLQRYQILNGAGIYYADQIAHTAANAFGVPIAIAALNTRYRHWYHSAHGVEGKDFDRLQMYCAPAILAQESFVLEDMREDMYFGNNPIVTGPPLAVFMAGAPLRDPDGKRFGTLCLIDHEPREFSDKQIRTLESFAQLMSDDICLRSAGRYAVRDLIELEKARCDLFDLAMTDPLTKALNRRAFFRFAEREVHRLRRHGNPMSVLMLDVDKFKMVNDVHGHAAGDVVLQKLVELATQNVREEDLVGRLGGEEFAILLPETRPERAEMLANRLREDVKKLAFQGDGGEFGITVSVGISEPDCVDASIKPALERADAALYSAKRNGRDRVETNTPAGDSWLLNEAC